MGLKSNPMSNNPFVPPHSEILTRVAPEIPINEITSDATQEIIKKMYDVGLGEQQDMKKPTLVGLAAPQIGISARIILIDTLADGKGNVGGLKVYINPKIIWKSKEENEWREGCYSTSRVNGIVSRPSEIEIEAYNKDGKLIREKHYRYTARIFMHEIDHLNGIVFVQHIEDDSKLHWVEIEDVPQYREDWREWEKLCPREKWLKIKKGE